MDAKLPATETSLTGSSELLQALSQQSEGFAIDLPQDWLQGRTGYGGLSAAYPLRQRSDHFQPYRH